MLDQNFDRLLKLVSQLEPLNEKLSQEDVNQKLLRSLSPKWNTHVVEWRNKADMDTMSMDDLYNNLKGVQSFKKSRHQAQKKLKKECAYRNIYSQALVSCDGLSGYDESDHAEEGPNYALMAFSFSSSDSKVSNDSTCSKSCLETVNFLKSQNEQLLKDLKKSKLMVLGYKTGLKSVEERLEFFKKNESIYLEDIKVLKVEIQIGEIAIRE
nr:hypothetical protein [Tanacetum cinerariifolium]